MSLPDFVPSRAMNEAQADFKRAAKNANRNRRLSLRKSDNMARLRVVGYEQQMAAAKIAYIEAFLEALDKHASRAVDLLARLKEEAQRNKRRALPAVKVEPAPNPPVMTLDNYLDTDEDYRAKRRRIYEDEVAPIITEIKEEVESVSADANVINPNDLSDVSSAMEIDPPAVPPSADGDTEIVNDLDAMEVVIAEMEGLLQ